MYASKKESKLHSSHKLSPLHNHPFYSANLIPEADQQNNKRKKYQAIQYAPLPLPLLEQSAAVNNVPQRHSNFDLHKSKVKHLEPRQLPRNNLDGPIYTPFILGHNIELLQSVSRSPGLNPAYRSYPEGSYKKQNKV